MPRFLNSIQLGSTPKLLQWRCHLLERQEPERLLFLLYKLDLVRKAAETVHRFHSLRTTHRCVPQGRGCTGEPNNLIEDHVVSILQVGFSSSCLVPLQIDAASHVPTIGGKGNSELPGTLHHLLQCNSSTEFHKSQDLSN